MDSETSYRVRHKFEVESSSFYTSMRHVPIDDMVADMAAEGRARRLGRRVVHVILHQLSAMDSRSSAPTVSHTYMTLSPYI